MISSDLLSLLACPKCKQRIAMHSGGDALVCNKCQLLYPVRDDIPIMLEEEATPLAIAGASSSNNIKRSIEFTITEGKNKGQKFKLPLGSCKAIGRSLEDANKTAVFSMDFTTSLDDFTKKVVMNYVAQRSPKSTVSASVSDVRDNLGGFKRLPDLVLDDPSISRLHAMVFHDESGVGVLDLVSKNGSFVNGTEIENYGLKDGDVIEIGATKIQVKIK